MFNINVISHILLRNKIWIKRSIVDIQSWKKCFDTTWQQVYVVVLIVVFSALCCACSDSGFNPVHSCGGKASLFWCWIYSSLCFISHNIKLDTSCIFPCIRPAVLRLKWSDPCFTSQLCTGPHQCCSYWVHTDFITIYYQWALGAKPEIGREGSQTRQQKNRLQRERRTDSPCPVAGLSVPEGALGVGETRKVSVHYSCKTNLLLLPDKRVAEGGATHCGGRLKHPRLTYNKQRWTVMIEVHPLRRCLLFYCKTLHIRSSKTHTGKMLFELLHYMLFSECETGHLGSDRRKKATPDAP